MATHEDLSRTHEVKASSNRSFGGLFAIVFLIIAGWPMLSEGSPRWWAVAVSTAFVLISWAAPKLLDMPNRLWLQLGLLLNRLVSPVALLVLYYAVVTPVAGMMRLTGKDNLKLRGGRSGASYWIDRDPPGPRPDSLNHQF